MTKKKFTATTTFAIRLQEFNIRQEQDRFNMEYKSNWDAS